MPELTELNSSSIATKEEAVEWMRVHSAADKLTPALEAYKLLLMQEQLTQSSSILTDLAKLTELNAGEVASKEDAESWANAHNIGDLMPPAVAAYANKLLDERLARSAKIANEFATGKLT